EHHLEPRLGSQEMFGNRNAGDTGAHDDHVLGHLVPLRYSPAFIMTKPSGRTPPRSKNKPSPRPSVRPAFRGLAALGVLLYAGTIGYQYVLDDDVITRANRFVQEGISGIPDIFSSNYLYGFNRSVDLAYRPIPVSSTAVEVGLY